MSRRGGASPAQAIQKIRAKSVKVLAWVSLAFALIGGTFAAGTPVGDFVRTILGWIPWWWVPAVILLGLAAWTLVDLLLDGEPNHPAVWTAIISPSVATAAAGRLGSSITGALRELLRQVDGPMSEWVGTGSSIGLTAACIVVALVLARRVVQSGPAGAF